MITCIYQVPYTVLPIWFGSFSSLDHLFEGGKKWFINYYYPKGLIDA